MAQLAASYMGEGAEEFAEVADAQLIVEGQPLPVHATILAQHSPVLLGLCSASRGDGVLAGQVRLEEPFRGYTLPGVTLFLRWCYARHQLQQHIAEAFAADRSGASVQEALRLAHMLGAAGLLADAGTQLLALAKVSPTGGLPGGGVVWLAVAESCGLKGLLGLLCSHMAERLGEAAGEERQALLQELLAASGRSVGAETVARVLTQALDASRRSGPVEWVVEDFCCLQGTVNSPSFSMGPGPFRWYLVLHPQGRQGINGSRPGYVAVDVAVVSGDLPAGWQVQAKTRITLVNHRDPALSKVFQDEVPATFTEERSQAGWKHVIARAELEDGSRGFLVGGAITIRAEICREGAFTAL